MQLLSILWLTDVKVNIYFNNSFKMAPDSHQCPFRKAQLLI